MQQATIEGFRLSPQQSHLWRLQPDAGAVPYRAHCTVCIDGPLDIARLQAALAQLVERHELLRTTFQRLPAMEVPLQVIGPAWQPTIVLNAGHSEHNGDGGAHAPIDAQRADGPLAVALTRLAADQHRLHLALPALYADVVGLENLVRELCVCYGAGAEGGSLPVDEEMLQYVDLAEWQNELLESEETADGRAYWRQRAVTDLPALQLPFTRRRLLATDSTPGLQNGTVAAQPNGHGAPEPGQRGPLSTNEFAPERYTITLPTTAAAQLAALAEERTTTAATLLLACWQILLWRLTVQEEVVVGVAYTGRKFEELHDALGLFARHLPVHTTLDAALSLTELARQLHEQIDELAKWQEYFDGNASAATQSDEGAMHFPFCFEYTRPLGEYNAGDVTFAVESCSSGFDRYQIKLIGQPQAKTLAIALDYDANLFPRAAIVRLADQYGALLAHALEMPDAPVGTLPLVSAEDQAELLIEFNATDQDFGPPQPVHKLFEEQAARQPQAVAAICETEQVTYGELNERANRLAHHLSDRGVESGAIVAYCLDRSLDSLVAMLAVMKTGATYLPLDPQLPPERLNAMIEDAGPAALIIHPHLDHLLVNRTHSLPSVDPAIAVNSQTSPSNLSCTLDPEQLAYVLYTSGSTGQPKGVCVTHANLFNYLHGIATHLDLPADGAYATVTTFAADLGNTAIFPALCRGGSLHVISQERAADAAALAAYMRQHPIDVLKIVPSHLAALLNSADAADLLPRQHLIVGGEAFPWELAARVRALAPDCQLINHYGPTETTIGVLTHTVARDDGERYGTATVPTGRPLPNTCVYLLDEALQPVPVWVPGELYIGGAQVTAGYLKRPELTDERFVANPFVNATDARLYRTGDRARFLPDGTIEFLGRLDQQTKIRGFRIELGEIEAVLRKLPAIRDCVVIAQEHAAGDKRLIAYVVSSQQNAPTAVELRRDLAQYLPDYMVPADVVTLDALPLTVNGKIDRRALPEPKPVQATAYVAPRTPLESTIAELWAEVLGVEQVGVNDNFFALGGHSLMATQLISRVRLVCQVELPLRQLFDAPTVAGLAAFLESDAAQQHHEQADERPALAAVSRTDPLPLSFAQQRLWFLDQLEPGSAFYNLFASLRLTGQLNLQVLTATFNEIVRRHEILRTTFPTVAGKAVQVIAPPKELPLPLTDLSSLEPTVREQRIVEGATAAAQQPFDLANGPLLRIELLRVATDEHIILLTMHHIISDGWSSAVLVREVAAIYTALVAEQPSPLPELPLQYADYAQWQREWLQGEVLATQLDYWRQQLAGELPVLQLPTDRPRPAVQQFRGARHAFSVDAPLAAALQNVCEAEGVSLFMLLLAGFDLLLHRYTGQEDLIVGSPVANRNRHEIESLIGFFVNTLALRTDLTGEPTVRELIQRVRRMTLDAVAHQDLPFERLVDELQPDRDLSRTPLFQVVFVLGNMPREPLALPNLTLTPIEVVGETAKFDLTLYMTESPAGLLGRVEYNTDLFDERTIAAMMAHFRTLLAAMVANPEQSIAALPLLSRAERQQLLTEWNRAQVSYPAGESLHQRFAASARQRPHATAFTLEGRSLRYGELDARANQLAHHLRARGVGTGTLVALYVERSLEMVVGILGILKAGAAYVPMDPTYPADRVAFMLQDSAAPLLLTEDDLLAKLLASNAQVSSPTLQTICLDADWPEIAREKTTDPNVAVAATSPAYVIYTSGSTGQPKGVVVSHYNVLRLFAATQAWYNFDASDVWTLFHSYAFDFSVWELWGALLYGGRLVLVPYWVSRTPDAFYKLLVDEKVTVLNQTPSAFRQLIQAETAVIREQSALSHASPPALDLRCVIFGGEALELQSLRPWFERHGDQRPQLVNMYGITETTVHVTYRPISLDDLASASGSVIGQAIPDLDLYVLDGNLEPVPVGVPGELHVGGAGVALGYLNRPTLTEERFIPDPFGTAPDARLYKSGDLVRYLPDGDLEYLGRIDQQVKIRGFRIELGEIEALLAQHPMVRDVAVLARAKKTADEPADEQWLVAYLVGDGANNPSVADLRSFLQTQLPDYMVPAAFVWLDALPLTANGKLDRRALPAPADEPTAAAAEYVPPSNEVETALATIWADVLGMSQVGVEDNFFALGGDSILTIQIIARANAAGLQLTPKQIFQYQTIAGLAAVAGSAVTVEAEQGLVSGPVPLTPIQQWFFAQELPAPHHWNQARLIAVRDPLDPSLLEAAVAQLILHHDALRLHFTHTDQGWQQTHREPDELSVFSHHDLTRVARAEQRTRLEAMAAECQGTLDLANGPLLRVAHVCLGADEPERLLFIVHHLAIDGVSWQILLDDLLTLYRQLAAEQPMQLASKTTSFQAWARRLTEYAQAPALQAELDYWLTVMDAPAVELPTDHPATADLNTEASAREFSATLTAAETTALLQDVQPVYNTQINDLLLTALVQTFHGWTGEHTLLLDLEGHGRVAPPDYGTDEDIDLSRTVGWFTTIFPLRLAVTSTEPGAALMAVKEQLRSIPNHGVGYGLLRYLQADRAVADALGALPQPTVSFNYLGNAVRSWSDDSPFAPAVESRGPLHDPRGQRQHLLDIRGSIANGELEMVWTYSANFHDERTIEQLAQAYLAALRALIAHCQSPDAGGFTPSDFELSDLSQSELEKAFAEIEF